MTPMQVRETEQKENLIEIQKTLISEGLECWGNPKHPWCAVMMPSEHLGEIVLEISPGPYYGWHVSLAYHEDRTNGSGCSCNPQNNHNDGLVEINRKVMEECLQRGLGFAATLKGVKLHTKASYLKHRNHKDYVMFKV